jgi:hypothetical protein
MTAKRYPLTIALVVACAVGSATAANLVVNGSFESGAVGSTSDWDIYESIEGWQLSRGPAIELQRDVLGWDAYDGEEYLELDSDIDGPDGTINNDDASSAVFQDVATTPATLYELTFAFSARPGVEDNALEIWWEGNLIDTLTASGVDLLAPDWQVITYQVLANTNSTRLEFGDVSVSDSFGTFIDGVSLTPVPEPQSLLLLVGGALLTLRRRVH